MAILKPNNGTKILLECHEINHNLGVHEPSLENKNSNNFQLLNDAQHVEVIESWMPQNIEGSRNATMKGNAYETKKEIKKKTWIKNKILRH